jgi:hypothetical protein
MNLPGKSIRKRYSMGMEDFTLLKGPMDYLGYT